MIIRISLLLIISSIIVFIVADLSTPLGFRVLTDNLAQLGSAVILSAFALLVIQGVVVFSKATFLSVTDYFSVQQRRQRRLFFIQSKQDQINRLFYFKTLQMRYLTRHKIKRLLARNNQQQLQSLSKAIQNDLLLLKKNIPGPTFKQLQFENKRYRNQQDIEALLKLQQKISMLV
jgi:hypothetical protein